MSSYFKSFENFVQQKETNPGKSSAPFSDTEDESKSMELDAQSNVDPNSAGVKMMEHSYIRENYRLSSDVTGLSPARTILIRRPPQCPSCHTQPIEENDVEDNNQVPVPTYNEITSKEAMNECARIAKYVKNNNPDDEDWEARVNQMEWSDLQKVIFEKVARILDNDQLGRLANAGRPNEVLQRRCIVDKSASQLRSLFASICWDSRITEWLHCLLMDCLPSTYMASYLDILQTLKSKLPLLMDKMLFGRPLNYSQEILAPVLTKQWEPELTPKVRKLNHDAIIIAIPSMPYSGPVPNRLQKWYQYLATITQIVQVAVPMTSGYNSNIPLDAIAEQTVSLVRVKIQELRQSHPTSSIILLGFNAGAALALQVAMVELVAGVVCVGFAYNTMNGTRGAPDDRILDIKIPILFVIGQSAARTSPEEIESMREKMQSETSLVIVGCGDDVLRVPKSRRKIESVTQSMVDNMVVDEIFEFINKILTNPPGPRVPTPVTNLHITKHHKTLLGNEPKAAVVGRKRKVDVTDGDPVPVKTKYVGQAKPKKTPLVQNQDSVPVKRKVGRPRTRPLPTPGVKPSRASNVAGTKAVQNKVSSASNNLQADGSDGVVTGTGTATVVVAGANAANHSAFESTSKLPGSLQTSPIKTTILNPMQKPSGVTTLTSIGGAGAKIKMIPNAQFVQLKSSMQSQSKIYTIKTPAMMGQQATIASGPSNANTGQQIFTLKSPGGQTTQFVTASQQKYTVVKNISGGTTIQLTPTKSAASTSVSAAPAVGGSNVDMASIIDMPILFADNDGNLSESVAQKSDNATKMTAVKPSTSSGVGQLIISQKIIKEADSNIKPATVVAQPQQAGKPNKVVFINRSTMKPITAMHQSSPKFTKVVVSNSKTQSTTLLPRPVTPFNNLVSPIVMGSGVKQVNMQGIKTPVSLAGRQGGIINVAGKPLQNFQIIGSASSGTATTATTTSGDKPQIRNIVVKPGALKQIPNHLKTQLFNRNLTVRKLVNIVPVSKAGGQITFTSATPASTSTQAAQEQASVSGDETTFDISDDGSSANTSANTMNSSGNSSGLMNPIQSSPKIITLNTGKEE